MHELSHTVKLITGQTVKLTSKYDKFNEMYLKISVQCICTIFYIVKFAWNWGHWN